MPLVITIRKSVVYTCVGLLLAAAVGWGVYRRTKAKRVVVHEIYVSQTSHPGRLLRGFFEANEAWRYTGRVFAVSLDPTRMERPVYLELDFAIPSDLMREHPTVSLTARVNGIEIGKQVYFHDGRYTFQRYVPLNALKQRPAVVEFEADLRIYKPRE